MKFSIGLRLFIAVLLSIFGVAALALALMAEKVNESFADYAIQIELNRLQEVVESLQMRYAEQKNWSFLPQNAQEKRDWISEELLRLYRRKNSADAGGQLILKVIGSAPIALATPQIQIGKITGETADAMLPPLPPMPPVPPAPPAPPVFPESSNFVSGAATEKNKPQPVGVARSSLPSLYTRITLVDQDRRYLAGRILDKASSASRSIYFGDRLIGFLQVTKSDQPTDAMAKDFLQKKTDIILIIVALSVLLSAVAASFLAMHFRRPIRRLVEGSRLLAKGDFSTRLKETRSDELGELAHSFNQLADKLEQAEQTRKQWVADTSHELRTPISVLRAQLEAMQDGIRQASPENIALMLRQILSLNKLIDELYALARADVGDLQYHMQSLNVWDLLLEEADNFKEKLATKQLGLNAGEEKCNSKVLGDPDRLRQVFINLLENCVRYTAPGGCISLSFETNERNVVLNIDDSAPAVPDEALSRLGERFYRVDPSRNRQGGGAGLGLALCVRIMAAHHGKIEFSHAPTGGLRARLFFPLGQV
jgi:two-component system sensor histidine kinase BaeS